MVRYSEFRPSPRLQPFVSTFWILDHDGQDPAPQRVVPDGRSELILSWKQPFESLQAGQWSGQPRCFLAGQIHGPLMLRPSGPAKTLGIRFHAHGATKVFAPAMDELSGRFTPVEDLSPSLARDLSAALDSPDPIAAIETALLSASSARGSDVLIAEAVRRIAVENGGTDISALARDLGLSTRQFERRFIAAVGLRPKLFCRIQRFNKIFRILEQPSRAWAETAVACGYYDQAHLIRDCKSFSGNTPPVLLADDADLARHFYRRHGLSHLYNTARNSSS